jgi:hypothetical protein
MRMINGRLVQERKTTAREGNDPQPN